MSTEIADGKTRRIHMCIDIAGVLRWPDKDLGKLFTDDDGSHKPGRYVRDWLKLQLAQGKRVLPMSKDCVGFDYQKGCPSHVIEESNSPKQIPTLTEGTK